MADNRRFSDCAPDGAPRWPESAAPWATQPQNVNFAPGGPQESGGIEEIWAAEGSPVGWGPGSSSIPYLNRPPFEALDPTGALDAEPGYWYWQGALMTALSRETIEADRYLPRIVAFPIASDTDGSGDVATGLLFEPGQTRKGTISIQPGSLLIAASSFADVPPGGGGDCCSFRVRLQDAGAVADLFAGSYANSKTQFGDTKATANPGQVILEPSGPFFFPAPHSVARPGTINWAITALEFAEPFYIQCALHFAVPLTGMALGRPGDEAAEVVLGRYAGRQAASVEPLDDDPFSGRAIPIGEAGHNQRR